jgi:ABC-2 type transport system permease protein/oleandomycin transport system permease protein
MSRAAVLAGRTLSDVATNALSLAVITTVGVIAGFGFGASLPKVLAGFALMLLFGYAFSWLFAWIGLLVSSPESANSVGFIAIFPLTFASSAFVPVDSMPSWLEAFAKVNSFTTTVDAMRALWLDAPAHNDVWGAFAWTLGMIAVFAPLAVARYRRVSSA